MTAQHDRRAALIASLREAAERGMPTLVFVHRADALKAALPHGARRSALKEALAGITSAPDEYLSRKRKQAKRDAARHAEETKALNDGGRSAYEALAPLLHAPEPVRSMQLEAAANRLGCSARTLKRRLSSLAAGGSTALNRKPRADRGRSGVPDEVAQAFRQLLTDRMTKHLSVSHAIFRLRQQFPGMEISESALRRIARSIPKAVMMSEKEWRSTFLPGGPVEVPYANHTHVFDMAKADLFVWDGDPEEKPYRPHLTAVLDEATRSCMFARYTKDPPSTAVLQAVLAHAILPKDHLDPELTKGWIQCGIPEHLHADNGKVQDSKWLEAICRTLSTELRLKLDVRHAGVRAPWEQGHIERFFGRVHIELEAGVFPQAYCGRSPEHRPEGFMGSGGTHRHWRDYPRLEYLNVALVAWIVHDYHYSQNRMMKCSPLEAWQRLATGHIRVADEEYLREVMLQRCERDRPVRRGKLEVNTYFYWHESLQGYEEAKVQVRWDPADLDRIWVADWNGRFICWATREKARNVDSPADLAEHREQKRLKRQTRKALTEATRIAATADEGTFQQLVTQLHDKRREAGILSLPVQKKQLKPEQPDELTADEILSMLPEEAPAREKITLYGLEV
jgi:hypothetical protein